jgi:3-deoxy-manno-octulosonate cytidylyltransferase (CMP-KDO synthetase)
MTVLVVIPARYASTRLPGKPLLTIDGEPMIAHVVAAALRADVDGVLVATDHPEIAAAARAAGAEAVLTDPELPSGSDRVGAAMVGRSAAIVVNVQGDEPELDPAAIDAAVAALRADPLADIATLSAPLSAADLSDPNCVKVVSDVAGRALFFSRAAIGADRSVVLGGEGDPVGAARRHVGIYAYRAAALTRFLTLPPHPLERFECLEQLRALANGMTITVAPIDAVGQGVDTPEDLAALRQRAKGNR